MPKKGFTQPHITNRIFMCTEKIFKTIKRKLQLFSREDATGFTLIEVIAAIGIISIGFVGSLVLLSKASSQATAIKDKVVAAHLAAEGVEVIRNLRDSNWLEGVPWLNQIVPANKKQFYAVVDYSSQDITVTQNEEDLTGTNEKKQCLNWDGNFYKHAIALDDYACTTSFRRLITLAEKEEDISGQKVFYLEIKSIVKWKEKGVDRELKVIDHLYDWK